MKQSENNSLLRLFFAVWPNEEVRSTLAAWQLPLRESCGGVAMRADTLHCTLVFLGEVEADRLEALQLAAQEVAGNAFEIGFDVARYWGHNHIVYAAPKRVPAALIELVGALQRHLSKHRFHFEPREYKPHVTLLRHSKWNDLPLPEMTAVHWAVSDFVLVCSLGDEHGPCYEVLARFGLPA